MALYFFNLHALGRHLPDGVGTELPDDESARAHASIIAHDLLRNNEARARSWRLEVCGPDRVPCHELVLADFDGTLDMLSPDVKNTLCRTAYNIAALSKEISSAQLQMERLRAKLRRSNGSLSLATRNGVRL